MGAVKASMSDMEYSARPLQAVSALESRPAALEGLWNIISADAVAAVAHDRFMARPVHDILLRHSGFAEALTHRLARKLADEEIDTIALSGLIADACEHDPEIVEAAAIDLRTIQERDPACPDLLTPFLYFKGYQALQAYRFSHWLWRQGRRHAAHHLQSRISEVFAVDIHPAAMLGSGIMVDHGTGLVIGETAVVEDDVSILQEVTLGGTGKQSGDRHPKIRRGVLIGAGAKILGNIEVGEGAKIGAGSIVLDCVAPFTTVVGVPARPVGGCGNCHPGLTMDHCLPADWARQPTGS